MAENQARKKFNLAIDPDVQPWLNYEAARRNMSATAYINQALREAQANAPKDVAEAFKAFDKVAEKDTEA